MKFIPILFSTEMVQAILAGRKTQTRRTRSLNKVNEQPNEWVMDWDLLSPDGNNLVFYFRRFDGKKHILITSPFGKPGDVLWVRESYHKTLAEELKGAFYYKATTDSGWDFKWKPSIHMPKQACRIFLKIKDVRVERLQDITEEDATNEGVDNWTWKDAAKPQNWFDYMDPLGPPLFSAEDSFVSLWDKINGSESWDSNPWVWVIEFEKIEKPENFLS